MSQVKNKRKRIQLNVNCSRSDMDAAKLMAARKGLSLAAYVRHLIRVDAARGRLHNAVRPDETGEII